MKFLQKIFSDWKAEVMEICANQKKLRKATDLKNICNKIDPRFDPRNNQ